MPARIDGRRTAFFSGAAAVALTGALAWLGSDHISFVLAFESLGKNGQGYAEYRHRQTGIVFVSLPGGTFLMGSTRAEREQVIADAREHHGDYADKIAPGLHAREAPRHEVTLSAFLIAKYEVTQAEWKRVMGDHGFRCPGDDLPADNLNRADCDEFCKRTGLALPTEAQWEYACRAGTTGPYGGTGRVDDMGWYADTSRKIVASSRPGGRKLPNAFGLFDMHGNVSELVEDLYEQDSYSRTSAVDPVCESGTRSISRGGNWCDPATSLRSAHRHRGSDDPSKRDIFVGMRPAYRVR